jgi:hypothetical protein
VPVKSRLLLFSKGGRKVEGKSPLPPLETPLYKGNPCDFVEVEVKMKLFMERNSGRFARSSYKKGARWCRPPLAIFRGVGSVLLSARFLGAWQDVLKALMYVRSARQYVENA